MQNINYAFLLSRPAWGAWIEIFDNGLMTALGASRPAWGAWIEINMHVATVFPGSSRPAWGAWIEMQTEVSAMGSLLGRAPHGARGLKCQQHREQP